MPCLRGGKLVARVNILRFQEVILCQDILLGRASCQQLEDILHAKSITPNAGTSATFSGLNRNPFEKVVPHGPNVAHPKQKGESDMEAKTPWQTGV